MEGGVEGRGVKVRCTNEQRSLCLSGKPTHSWPLSLPPPSLSRYEVDGLTKDSLAVLGAAAAETALAAGGDAVEAHAVWNATQARKGKKEAPFRADFDLTGESGRVWGRAVFGTRGVHHYSSNYIGYSSALGGGLHTGHIHLSADTCDSPSRDAPISLSLS